MQRILIVKFWALGDILMATPLLRALKTAYPDCSITWLVDSSYSGIVKDNDLVDDVIELDFKTWQGHFRRGNLFRYFYESSKLRRRLRSRNYDLAICLIPDKWWSLWFNAAKESIALFPTQQPSFLRKFYTRSAGVRSVETHSVDRHLSVLSLIGLESSDRRLVVTPSAATKAEMLDIVCSLPEWQSNQPYIILHPGTSHDSKCWPTAHFAALADRLRPDFQVVISGSSPELFMAEEILAKARGRSGIVNTVGRLTVAHCAALVRSAAGVVTGDTSMLHIASALDTPVVGIYGSTRPNEYRPLFGRNVLLFDNSVACSPCYKSWCKLKGDDYLLCQQRVRPELVHDRLLRLMNDEVSSGRPELLGV